MWKLSVIAGFVPLLSQLQQICKHGEFQSSQPLKLAELLCSQ